MKNSWIIALRELKERLGSRTFLITAILGPFVILSFLYLLFTYGGEGKQNWKILVVDPKLPNCSTGLFDNKIMPSEDNAIKYQFLNRYVELEEFRDAPEFQDYDALVEINEKVLANKVCFVFFRKKPSLRMQTQLHYQIERRLDEIMVQQNLNVSVAEFRKIKQPLNLTYRDVYDPYDTSSDIRSWVGMFFGVVIIVFIFLFGMTILRSVSYEKSTRIAEVLLASVDSRSLMLGKIIGIGLAAFIQFAIWFTLIGLGLYFMRETIFPDVFDPSNLQIPNANGTVQDIAPQEYNAFVELVFERLNLFNMIGFFLTFFIFSYLFYAAFFAAIGATAGSENDGQQFVLPLIMLLCFSVYSGYYVMQYPLSSWSDFLHYFPFTAPVVVMVKLALGYEAGHGYELYLSLLILILSGIAMLLLAGRLYKNGILQHGHRITLFTLFRWMKKQ
jgi:ABC-2 type transport system permease protein